MPRRRGGSSVAAALTAVLAAGLLVLTFAADDRRERPLDLEEAHGHNPSAELGLRTEADPLAEDPSQAGQWALPMDWPASAVHSILMKNGKVLFYRGDEDVPVTHVWDPATNQIQTQTVAGIIWCGGHSVLPDGRVLATGGATHQGAATGPRHAFLFDPDTQQWTRTVDMRKGRYYPTHILLGDGRTLLFSGADENGLTNEQVEAFAPGASGGADQWQLLSGAERSMTYYPRMHLLPNGSIVHVGPEKTTDLFDVVGWVWQVIGTTRYGKRTHGTSVMLPPGHERIMIMGGRDRGLPDPLATNRAEILDMSHPSPSWAEAAPMNHRRMHLTNVILPDGKVLVAGGTSDEDVTAVYPAEIYDPAANAWTVVASMRTRRGYHSSAALLPDGRVLWAGSNGNKTAEVFSPPYLFRGARPSVTSAPTSALYGQDFTVQTPDAASIASVALLRPNASTHAFEMEQRYVPLPFSQSGSGSLAVTAPFEPDVAPPGYYMLFLVNTSGVPSVARFVLLGGTVSGNRRPVVDAGLSQTTVYPGGASLNGSVSDDGLPNPPGIVQTQWTRENGPGTVVFDNPQAVDTTATFSEPGSYVLRLTANDGEMTGTDTTSVLVNEPGAGGYPVEVRVSGGSDDAEEDPTGSMSLTSSDLEIVNDGEIQKIGMRFNAIPIAQGETIVRAWVQFKVDETTSVDTSVVIQGQAADNAPAFTTSSGNISSRPRTSAAVGWTPAPWLTVGEMGPNQRTSDITPVIQEIVDRPGWAAGSSLVLIITGVGERVAEAYEGLPTGAPLLHVELADPPANTVPVVDAGTAQTIRMPQSAVLDATVIDDGLPIPPGAVSALWVKESGPGTGVVTFGNPTSVDTTASFSEPGRYVLELEASDGELLGTGAVAIEVLEPIPGLMTLDRAVAAGTDDAEQKNSSGSVSVTGGDLNLGIDSSAQTVGIRFAGINIPRGATIYAAHLQFMADEVDTAAVSLTIRGQAADNPPGFTTTKSSISSRPRTSAGIAWSPAPWPTVGEAASAQRSPDLSPILQELVNRPGWASGNAVVFIVTGTGRRTAESFEGGAAKAPRLHVEYQ
ncbi:MAG TPA: galactose oxidase-like domain-containing protein [Candidatus Polarisedimenticolia bacterium]|nr:galactose oxidase-like domain-containing protein [Candidatus Polarisedimenticolia bacterium]